MQYRNTEKSTMNHTVLGGIVVGVEGDEMMEIRFENLSKPRLGWYHNQAMIGEKRSNDSFIRVTLPNGMKAPLVGSLVAVYGVLVTDHESKAQILAEQVEDVTAQYYKPPKAKGGKVGA